MAQFVYLLEAIVHGRLIHKIGMTTRTVSQRVRELNNSWSERDVSWSIVRVLVVTDCEKKELELHRRYSHHRLKMSEVSEWLGGICDGDSEIFATWKNSSN
jgi:uncharacterized protein YjaG (DUF416 family)